MKKNIYNGIKDLLKKNRINFKEIHHIPTRTSQESAEARGEPLKVGGKAILLRIDNSFVLFVLSAQLKINSKIVKKHFKARSIRFATREELFELTGLEPGSVPPFGKPFFSFPLFVDESILENDKIGFNAGSLTNSIIMSVEDYIKVANPEGIFKFSKA